MIIQPIVEHLTFGGVAAALVSALGLFVRSPSLCLQIMPPLRSVYNPTYTNKPSPITIDPPNNNLQPLLPPAKQRKRPLPRNSHTLGPALPRPKRRQTPLAPRPPQRVRQPRARRPELRLLQHVNGPARHLRARETDQEGGLLQCVPGDKGCV